MGNYEKFCQSCGLPMEKDIMGGGTKSDGTLSKKYCSYCYAKGQFKDNFKESREMIFFVKRELKNQGVSPAKRWLYTSHIAKLDRWQE